MFSRRLALSRLKALRAFSRAPSTFSSGRSWPQVGQAVSPEYSNCSSLTVRHSSRSCFLLDSSFSSSAAIAAIRLFALACSAMASVTLPLASLMRAYFAWMALFWSAWCSFCRRRMSPSITASWRRFSAISPPPCIRTSSSCFFFRTPFAASIAAGNPCASMPLMSGRALVASSMRTGTFSNSLFISALRAAMTLRWSSIFRPCRMPGNLARDLSEAMTSSSDISPQTSKSIFLRSCQCSCSLKY